jgi:VIT1/CCC1 family predicted Fe2+/Mn2+ transporter
MSHSVIIILGVANLVADGFSMGASAYLSHKADKKEKNRSRNYSLMTGLATFGAFVVAGALPLIPYLISVIAGHDLSGTTLFIISSVIAGLVFVVIGYAKAHHEHGARAIVRSVIEALVLGAVAASLSFLLGSFLESLL